MDNKTLGKILLTLLFLLPAILIIILGLLGYIK